MATKPVLLAVLLLAFSISIFGQTVPPAPTGLRVTATECGKISLAWDDYGVGINEDRYDLYRSSNGENGFYSFIGSESSNTLKFENIYNFSDPGVIYFYKIKAFFGVNSTSFSLPISASYTCEPPTGLVISNSICGTIGLSWNDFPPNNNEIGFLIFRSESENGNYISLGSVEANVLNFEDKYNLVYNKTYYYKIKGKFGFNTETAFSNTVSASFTCQSPSNLSLVSSDCNGITLNWADYPAGTNENGYEIFRANNGETSEYYSIGSTQANVLTFIDEGNYSNNNYIGVGKTYFYKIKGKFNSTLSDFGNVLPANFDCQAPTNFRVSDSNCPRLTMSWDAHPTGNATEYFIRRYDQGLNSYFSGYSINPNNLSFTENYLTNGKDYYYKIAAKVKNFYTAYSEPILVKLVCAGPTGLTVTETSCGKVKLAWNDILAPINESGYSIFRSENDVNYAAIGTVNGDILTFEDLSSMISCKTYYYKISARFGLTNTNGSESVSASFICPSAPTNFRVISSDCGNINFAWDDLPAEFNEDGFEIYKIIQGNLYSNVFKLGTVGPNITNFSDIGYSYESGGFSATDVEYKYFIRAKFNNSYSGNSNQITGSFTCPIPPNPNYISNSCGNIKISWPDFPSNYSESGFEIYRASAANGYYAKVGQVTANILEYDDINNTSISNERFYDNQEYFYKIKGLFNNNTTELSTGYTQGSFDCLPPQNLRVTNNSYTGVSLAWDAGNPPSSLQAYWIEKADNIEFENFQNVGSVNGNTLSYTNNYYFEDGKKYYYRVQWLTNKSVFSGYSNIVEFTYSAGPKFPGEAIQNLQIESANCNGVSLSWDDLPANLLETGYSVFRTSKPYYSESLEIRKIADLPANATSYFDVGTPPINELLFGQPLEYYIVANMSNSLNKIESTHQSTTINCGNEIILTTSQSQNCDPIVLNWTDLGPSFEETKFTIHRKNEADENYRWIAEVNANTFTYTDNYSQYIKSNENIKYKIIGVKNYIESKASNELSVVPTCPVEYNLTANTTCNGIILNWVDLPTGTTENGFHIYRSVNNVEFEFIDYVQTNTFSYLDIKETLDRKTYYYKIAAVKSNFLMGFSNTVSGQINCFQAPVISVTATSCGKINLAWSNNNTTVTNTFTLYRSTDGINGEYKFVFPKSNLASQNNTHEDAAGDYISYGNGNNGPIFLTSNTDYFYKVVQQIGNVFVESNIIAGQFTCPNVPTGLKISSINCNSVDISWNPSDGHGKNSSGYEVFRSDNGINGEYKKQYNFSNYLGKTSFKDYPDINYSELVPGKTYYYKIRFYLDFIGSQFTAPVEVKLGTNMNTTQSGQWQNPETWSCGRIPTSLDEILINNGHAVTIGTNLNANAKNLTNNGEIIFGENAILILNQN